MYYDRINCRYSNTRYFCKKNPLKNICIAVLFLSVFAYSCAKVDVFEKNVPLPNHEWDSRFKPTISFDIEDTASFYNIYLILRHTDAYDFNNIWLNVSTKDPVDSMQKQQLDIQ